MIYNDTLAKELDSFITAGLDQLPIPYEKGNSIRLKYIAIRKHKNGYKLFNTKTNTHMVTVFCKTAALAIAKLTVESNLKYIDHAIRLDNKVNKYYMDALFAKRTLEISKDPVRKESSEIKFDIAMDAAWSSLAELETFIFDK